MKKSPALSPSVTDVNHSDRAPVFQAADPTLWNSAYGRRQFLKTTGKASAVTAIASTGMLFEVAYADSGGTQLLPDYIEYTLSSCASGTWTGTGTTREIALANATTAMQTARPQPAFQHHTQLATGLTTWVGKFDPAPPTGDPFSVSIVGPTNGSYTATLKLTTAQTASYVFDCYKP